MTQEQKDLLIKDLCGRLSHGVKCKILETNEVKILGSIQYDSENTLFDFWEDEQKIQYGHQLYLSEFKPCLFPLSSMSEDLKNELYTNLTELELKAINDEIEHSAVSAFEIDFYHKHHIDYRGIIPMGLAIDATELNVY
jgi:hypothetical protein